MLSLMDPVELDDLVVFRDDEDPRKFYLLPDQPVVSLDEDGEPEFLFVKFIRDLDTIREGDEAAGAYIQLRTTLTIAAERRERVIAALRTRLEQEKSQGKTPFGKPITLTEPLLAAPLWTSGHAGLATFQVGESGLVRHATEQAPADLAGDLGASFRLNLDNDGGEIFWTAFKNFGGQVPILITYELKYKARVSARMTIKAKRDVVHRQVWQYAQPYRLVTDRFPRYVKIPHAGPLTAANLAMLKTQWHAPVLGMVEIPQIREAVHQTVITNAIDVRIETDQAGGGQSEAEVREMMFKLATEVLSEKLIPTLFDVRASLPGAASEQDPQATKQLVEVKEEVGPDSSATFELTLDHQTSIERSVNPNGPIQLSVPQPEKLVPCFREVRAGDGFYKELNVTASTAGVNFERDGIDQIHVWLRYDEIDELDPARERVRRQDDRVLHSEKESVRLQRFDLARSASGGHKRTYQYRTKVFYKDGPPSPPGDGAWSTSSDRMLIITPRAMGAIRVDVLLTAPPVVESARVSLRHESPAGPTLQKDLELTPQANRRTWFQYTGAADDSGGLHTPPRFRYQVTYRVSGNDIVMPWTEAATDLLELAGPFVRTLTWTLRPQGRFEGVASVAGEIVYEDRDRRYRVSRPIELKSLTDSLLFTVPILPNGPETARWTARVIRSDGTHEDLPPGEGPAGTIWLGLGGGSILRVQVLADLIDFDRDVELALVQLRYNDGPNRIVDQKAFTFTKTAKTPQIWTVGLQTNSPRKYDADVRYIAYDRTHNSETQLRQIEDQVLILDRPHQ